MILVLLVGVWMTAAGLVIPFFNLYFLRTHELTVARIGWIFALSQALAAAVIFGSGLLASRLGPARMLAVWMLLFGPALWILGAAHSLGLAVAIFLVQGLVPPATTPLIDQLLLERAPDNRHGAVSSWRNAATELSGLVGATAGGLILAGGSFRLLFGLAGGVGLAGALALILALSRSETEA
jgi:MFS family permease